MRPLRIVALLSFAILLVAVPAVTQTTHQVTISIPNSFMAGDVLLSPGDYTISTTTNPVILAINGPRAPCSFMLAPYRRTPAPSRRTG